MSDKPTKGPKPGKTVTHPEAKHEKAGYGGGIRETSPGIIVKPVPKEGKECAYAKVHTRQENKFNRRGAVRVWNKVRPHIPADVAGHNEKTPGDQPYPKKVQSPECAPSYDGHKIQ